MVRLDCSGITFGSHLDEKHLFTWAKEIPGVMGWEQDTLLIRRRTLSEASLRDLLALFHRYEIPMEQLQVFLNDKNKEWFANPIMYWHKKVFAKKFATSLDTHAKRGSARRYAKIVKETGDA